jgi:AraC family transcriptional regulator
MYGSHITTHVWSSGARWGGVVLELHRIQHADTSALFVHEHTVIVHRACATTMEFENAGEYCRQALRPGEVSLFRAGAPREVRFGPSEQLVLTLTPEFVTQAVTATNAHSLRAFEEKHALNDPQILQIATGLEAEANAGYPSGRVYGESMGIALTAHLMARHSTRRPASDDHKGGMSPCALRRVLGYIDDHLAEDMRLDDLAQVAGLSPHRFAHNFKRATGLPPHQFVIHRRVEHAKPLLRDTDMTMTTVTYALGFGGPSRFAHLFRRETGLTPSRYRSLFR